MRRNWTDTKRTPIDTRLADILDGLAGMAAGIRTEREKWAEWKRRHDLEEARRAERAREAERVRLLRVRFVEAMQRWEQAARLRRFTQAVEAHLAHLDTDAIAAGRQWLAWARLHTDALDPIISDFSSITSQEVDVPTWFTGRGGWERKPRDWWAGASVADHDEDEAEEAQSVSDAPDPAAHWRRVRSGWYGR